MKTPRIKFGSVVFAIIILLIVVVAYLYMDNVVGNSVSAALEVRDRIQSAEVARIQNKTLTAVDHDTSSLRSSIASTVLSSKDIVKLIVSIESIGPQSGSTLTLSANDAPKNSDDASSTMKEAIFKVGVQGSWSSIIKALELAETLPYATRLEKVSMDTSVLAGSSAKQTKQPWNLSFELHAILNN